MIADKLANSHLYLNLSSGLERGIEYLSTQDLQGLEVGRYPIEGDRVFALVQEYDSKPLEEGKYETHRKYIDIQYIVSGREFIGYTNVVNLKSLDSYDGEKDIQFFAGEGDLVRLEAGMFAVFFPEDAHMPCISVDGPEAVKKVVIKVAV